MANFTNSLSMSAETAPVYWPLGNWESVCAPSVKFGRSWWTKGICTKLGQTITVVFGLTDCKFWKTSAHCLTSAWLLLLFQLATRYFIKVLYHVLRFAYRSRDTVRTFSRFLLWDEANPNVAAAHVWQ